MKTASWFGDIHAPGFTLSQNNPKMTIRPL
jgi:hypothetical protein